MMEYLSERYEEKLRKTREMAASVALRSAAILEMGPTRYTLARTIEGKDCCPESDWARTFCALGAMDRATFEIGNWQARLMVFTRLDRVIPDFVKVNNEEPDGPDRIIKALRVVARDLESGL